MLSKASGDGQYRGPTGQGPQRARKGVEGARQREGDHDQRQDGGAGERHLAGAHLAQTQCHQDSEQGEHPGGRVGEDLAEHGGASFSVMHADQALAFALHQAFAQASAHVGKENPRAVDGQAQAPAQGGAHGPQAPLPPADQGQAGDHDQVDGWRGRTSPGGLWRAWRARRSSSGERAAFAAWVVAWVTVGGHGGLLKRVNGVAFRAGPATGPRPVGRGSGWAAG